VIVSFFGACHGKSHKVPVLSAAGGLSKIAGGLKKMIRPKLKFLGLAACLAWAALPLAAQRETPARVELITSHHGRTPALLSYVPGLHAQPNAPFSVFPLRKPSTGKGKPGGGGGGGTSWTDPDLQKGAPGNLAATAGNYFAGVTADGYVPPDPNISVGPTQIVETTNVNYAVYDKTGNVLLGPAPLHTIWQGGLPSSDLCATTDGGDPIVLWDKPDGKWIISQLAYNSSLSVNEWCMAVSKTNDAAGAYDVYSYPFGSNLPDYPKLGVWNEGSGKYSGIYFSANIFANGNSFTGAKFCALPLASGDLSTMTCVQNSNAASVLPADLEGTTAAASGAGDFYLDFSGSNTLNLYQFRPDFSAPNNTTLAGPTAITVGAFHEACGGGACVPQSGTREKLDSLGDRLMYRLSYRNYGSYDALVVNQSVQVSSSSNQTGVRWYEIDNPGSNPVVTQESTYSPDTSLYRWMGSIAQDHAGDLGLGFSTSSSSTDPSVGFAGRQAGDTANTMEAQATIHTGTSYQSRANRWGDYSSVSVDPADDCTFWYVNEYLLSNGTYTNWGTYIGSYKFSACH
jgi:hypothetical protein